MNVETLYSLIPDLCLIVLAITAGVRYSRLYFKYKKNKETNLMNIVENQKTSCRVR